MLPGVSYIDELIADILKRAVELDADFKTHLLYILNEVQRVHITPDSEAYNATSTYRWDTLITPVLNRQQMRGILLEITERVDLVIGFISIQADLVGHQNELPAEIISAVKEVFAELNVLVLSRFLVTVHLFCSYYQTQPEIFQMIGLKNIGDKSLIELMASGEFAKLWLDHVYCMQWAMLIKAWQKRGGELPPLSELDFLLELRAPVNSIH